MKSTRKTVPSRSKSTEPSSTEGARRYALKLLADQDYSVARLKQKLRARNFAEEDLEEAVSGLEAENWVSDRRFAERFAESALRSGRYYGFRLRVEMQRRGIPEEIVSEVLTGVLGERSEDEDALSALARRFPDFSFPSASDREKRRVLDYLRRRGFTLSAALRAMKAEES